MPYMEDLIILFSGGADSTLLMEIAKHTRRFPLALMIDYDQLHIKELEYAKKYLKKNNIKNLTVKLEGYNVNSALTGNGVQGLYKDINIYNVPQRNTIFLSIAAGIAESRKINEVWFGASWEDYELKFPDCFQHEFESIPHLSLKSNLVVHPKQFLAKSFLFLQYPLP